MVLPWLPNVNRQVPKPSSKYRHRDWSVHVLIHSLLPLQSTTTSRGLAMSSSHLEPVSLNDHYVQDVASGVVVGGNGVADRREVHVGSLGLGNALAVAYDIYGDAQLPFASLSSGQHHHHPHVQTTPQLTAFQPLVNGAKTVGGVVYPFQAAAAALHYRHSQQYGQQQQHYHHHQQQTPNFDREETATTAYPTSSLLGNIVDSWVTSGVYHPATLSFSSLDNVAANSYLTPIRSIPSASNPSSQRNNNDNSSSNSSSSTNCPLVPPVSMSTVVSAQRILSTTAMTTTSPTDNSFASPLLASSGTNGCSVPCGTYSTDQRQQQPVLSSHYNPVVSFPIPSSSALSMSSTSSTSSSCPSTASPPSTAFLGETNGGGQQQQQPHGYHVLQQNSEHHHPLASGVLSSGMQETSPPPGHAGSGGSQNAASVDETLYEITDEELREIDASLANSPDVMASRQWKYYIETNEWTRATCALMACLFTREQMANSTVLGRGGSQRARLPSNLVAYVVSTIRRRFNKPAAAVRARMAQKCKDERRFGRVACSQNGSPTPVAALTGKFNSSGSSSGLGSSPSALSRRSRKRSSSSVAGIRQSSSSRRCYSPPLTGSQVEAGYQPTGALLPNGTCASNQHPHIDEDLSNSSSQHHQLLPIPLSPPSASLSQSSLLTAPLGNDFEETSSGGGGTGAGGVLSQVLNLLPSPLVQLGSGVRAESGAPHGGEPPSSVLSSGSVAVVVSPSPNG